MPRPKTVETESKNKEGHGGKESGARAGEMALGSGRLLLARDSGSGSQRLYTGSQAH